jgi:hypothetical protein
MRGGFFGDSTVITAWLSQKRTDIVTQNRFAALESCATPIRLAPAHWTPESVKQFELNLIKDTADSLCKFSLTEKGRKECNPEKCFWHKQMKTELEQLKSKEPRAEENKDVSSPELPNAGSQRQKRDPSSESLDHRPLNCGMSQDSERTNRLTSKQNNQSGRHLQKENCLQNQRPKCNIIFKEGSAEK